MVGVGREQQGSRQCKNNEAKTMRDEGELDGEGDGRR